MTNSNPYIDGIHQDPVTFLCALVIVCSTLIVVTWIISKKKISRDKSDRFTIE